MKNTPESTDATTANEENGSSEGKINVSVYIAFTFTQILIKCIIDLGNVFFNGIILTF